MADPLNIGVINLAALDVIESVTAVHHASGPFAERSANYHRFRAEKALEKIASGLGFYLTKREPAAKEAAE